jgi:hypothetical protein
VCIGKTFAESAFMVVMPLVLKAFKGYYFLENETYLDKPPNNIMQIERQKIMVRLEPSPELL